MTTKSVVRWRQREATRGVRAVEEAGLIVERLEVFPDGKISIVTAKRPRVERSDADEIIARLR